MEAQKKNNQMATESYIFPTVFFSFGIVVVVAFVPRWYVFPNRVWHILQIIYYNEKDSTNPTNKDKLVSWRRFRRRRRLNRRSSRQRLFRISSPNMRVFTNKIWRKITHTHTSKNKNSKGMKITGFFTVVFFSCFFFVRIWRFSLCFVDASVHIDT